MRKAELLAQIADERARLEAVIVRFDAAEIEEPGAVGAWSAKDVLAHIAFWERTFRGWLESAARGESPQMPAPGLTWADVDLFNDRAYQASRGRSLDDVRGEFDRSYSDTLEAIRALDEAALIDPDRNPLGSGEALSLYAAANTSDHYREHRESLEAWLAARR